MVRLNLIPMLKSQCSFLIFLIIVNPFIFQPISAEWLHMDTDKGSQWPLQVLFLLPYNICDVSNFATQIRKQTVQGAPHVHQSL